jgi:hypothetical protein
MNKSFREIVTKVELRFKRLMAQKPVKVKRLPRDMPKRGVYLLSEGSRHLYVGRSNRLRQRLQEHGRASADHYSASFAFLIARHKTHHKSATYKPKRSRVNLSRSPRFKPAFVSARKRVAKMDIRWVCEPHQTRQALLELYAATALRTRYNRFHTY